MKNIEMLKNFLKDNESQLTQNDLELIKYQISMLEKAYDNLQKCLLEVEISESKQENLNKDIEKLSELAYV